MSNEKSVQKNDSSLGKSLSMARWFLLTIILIFACGGLVWYGQQVVNSINADFNQNNQKIETVSQALNTNREELTTVTLSQKNMEEMFKIQNFNLEQLRNTYMKQQETLNMLKNQISEVLTISIEVDDYWLKHQAEYFLHVARTEISLYGNQASAKSALIASQRSILQLPDKYQIVDQSIQLALSKLDPEGYKIKRSEILISLENIRNSVDSLFVNNIEMQQSVEEENEQQHARSVLENTWHRIVSAFKNLVVVSSKNDEQSLRPNATQKQITKTLIALQLEMIRFAVLQNDDDKYQASLNSCIELLEKNFSTDMPTVRDLIDQLNIVKNFELKQSVPEIDNALVLLQEVNTS